ncbi:MAG TPA: RHS repeat domain-containing protein [Verrucomicrobiae bacterium]
MNTLKYFPDYSILAVLLLFGATMSYASSVAYTYDAAGRIVAADYGAGKSISYAYDNAGNLIVSSQPSPGLLVSRPSASQIALFWPVAPSGFNLYFSGTLGAGAQWNLSGAIPFQTGDLNVVTQALGPFNTFYRLQK